MTMVERPLQIARIDTRRQDAVEALQSLRRQLSPQGDVVSEKGKQLTVRVFGAPLTPAEVVVRICDDVRQEGLDGLLRYSRLLDGAELTVDSLRVDPAAIEQAHREAEPEFLETVRRIRDNVLEFQTAILHRDVSLDRPHGVRLRQRYLPLRRVGVCVPGGAAAYPSTVLMTVVPAQAAGVAEIAVVAPPTKFGARNRDVLATCHELGVTEVYQVGGAQAVAALAYGVEGLPAVDKIVGPGNLFVALAKKHVFGHVDIDSIAGPSEVVVIGDSTTRPDFAAADLLAQAEHAPGASIFITWSDTLLEATYDQLNQQVNRLSRGALARQSLEQFAALIRVRDARQACEVTDLIAPEHLHIATQDAEQMIQRIRNAGATFLGNYTPVAVGDYVAGPSHVLPTGGTARWAAGLTANDFLRGGSLLSYSPEGLAHVADDVGRMADKEGLTAHRASVDIRLSPSDSSATPVSISTQSPFRPAIEEMLGYQSGEQSVDGKSIKLNTNENPYPQSPNVIAAIRRALDDGLMRYPDSTAEAFRIRAGEVLGFPPEWILCGNGSDDILTIVTRAFVGQGELLRLPYPSYILYRTLAEIQGARFEECEFQRDWSLADDFAAASEGLRLAFLPNPNSPSGTVLSPDRVRELADQLPCPLLVDEAYADFAETNCLDLVRENPHVLVSRTMSKSYGLAGLRFGFLVAQPEMIEHILKVKDSYNCDTLSIAGATAAIDDQAWLKENRTRIIATRTRLEESLRQMGFDVVPSQANFVWCSHREVASKQLYDRLKDRQILVRYMFYENWGSGLRVSVGTDDQMDAFLTVMRSLI